MAMGPDFKRLLGHPIKPVGFPQVLLVTLEDTAKFTGFMEPWRQAKTLLGSLRGRDLEGG
jgi:hypothetical protein